MTTILCTEKALYCDTMMVKDNLVVHKNYPKIFSNDLIYLGGAGSVSQLQRIIRYLLLFNEELLDVFLTSDPALIEDLPVIQEPDYPCFTIVLVDRRDGKAYEISEKCLSPIPVEYPIGIGSGGEMAKFAYLGGASAKRAMQVAIDNDVFSGGKVLEMPIKLL